MNFTNIKSALVSAVLMAILTVAGYVISLGNIFAIDWKVMANLGVISLLTGLVSLIKNYLTNDDGKFVGTLQIK